MAKKNTDTNEVTDSGVDQTLYEVGETAPEGVNDTDTADTDTAVTSPTDAPKRPGRKPGSVARPAFPWTTNHEAELVKAVYASVGPDGTSTLTTNDLHAHLSGLDLFASVLPTISVTNVRDRYKRINDRLAQAGKPPLPTLKPSPRGRTVGLTAEDIQRIADLAQQGVATV